MGLLLKTLIFKTLLVQNKLLPLGCYLLKQSNPCYLVSQPELFHALMKSNSHNICLGQQ